VQTFSARVERAVVKCVSRGVAIPPVTYRLTNLHTQTVFRYSTSSGGNPENDPFRVGLEYILGTS
jgi:hypothetical protein